MSVLLNLVCPDGGPLVMFDALNRPAIAVCCYMPACRRY